MADPLEQLSDSDLQALSKNDLNSMSDEGLKVVAASGKPAADEASKEEPLGHKIIREGLPIAGQIGGGLIAGALATPETAGAGTIPAAMAGAGVGAAAGGEAAGWMNHAIYGDEAPAYENTDDLKRVGTNFGIGAASELGGQVLAKGANTIAKPIIDKVGGAAANVLTKAGESLAAPTVTKQVETGLLDAAGKPITKSVTEAAKPAGDGPLSGWLDKALTAVGAKVAGPVGAVLAPQARRAITPTLASAANGLSQILTKTPQVFGKYAPALAKAAARGELSLNASVYVLQQRDPEFRQKMQELNSNGSLSQNEKNGSPD